MRFNGGLPPFASKGKAMKREEISESAPRHIKKRIRIKLTRKGASFGLHAHAAELITTT